VKPAVPAIRAIQDRVVSHPARGTSRKELPVKSISSPFYRVAACAAVLCIALLGISMRAPARAHADPFTANPYTGQFGSPNCTWYAWQRLHDTEHIDLQFNADAGYWITLAEQPNAAWSETANDYVPPQINTQPAAGDVAVLPVASSWANPFHVAYVEVVNGDGTIEVSEQSYGDYSAGTQTQPYPYVRYKRWNVAAMQQAERNQARFLHFGPVTPRAVDDFELAGGTTPATAPLNQAVHVALSLTNTGTTTWTAADGYALDEITSNCTTCSSSLVSVALAEQQRIAPRQTWTAAFDVSTGPGQMCATDTGASACDATAAACAVSCYFLPQFVMQHGTTAFGPVLPLSVLVAPGGVPGATPTPGATPAATPVASTPTATGTGGTTGDSATLSGGSDAPEVRAGQVFSISFALQNTGTTSWSDAGGYTLACTSNCLGATTVGLAGQSVAPGEQYEFAPSLTAPATPGLYHTSWALEDHGAPFGPNLSLDITVHGWTVLLRQPSPACDSPSGTVWFNPLPASTQAAGCAPGGYEMTQTTARAYAETDLKAVTTLPYDQTTFQARVTATFLVPNDPSTFAALIVQTPRDPTQAGGYIFGVAPDGHWRLQAVSAASKITSIAEGYLTPAATVTLSVTVRDGELSATINQQPVIQWNDTLGPSAELGLLVANDVAAPSSAVLFTAFELDQWT
jgi:surface antigen